MDGTQAAPTSRDNPERLLYLFALLSVVSIATILLVTGLGFFRIYSAQMILDAESDSIAVGEAIFAQEREVLLSPGATDKQRIVVADGGFEGLDRRMREFLLPFRIYKIKVFSRDKTIVYSTDHSIIGKSDAGNAKLDQVLGTGTILSHLETKDQVRDLADETRFDVDVVETYIPIRSGGAIVGSFEVYVDVTRTREKIVKVAAQSLGVLSLVLLVVFGGLYVPMRQGALRLRRTQDELQALANTDMLTGIFNRRFLFARIEEEYSRMKRERSRPDAKESLALIMIDIDHFKAINDSHGHLAGDEILRQITARLKERLRIYDVAGRYGGEEFLILLPHTDLGDARQIAERIHQSIRGAPFRVGELSVPVTVSIGVTYSASDEERMLDAIGRVDEGLYRAKNTGRDRVVLIPA